MARQLIGVTALLVGLAAALGAYPGAARQTAPFSSPQTSSSGGSRVMSPSVIGTTVAQADRGGPMKLQLLILWRGSPGWFYRRTGSPSMMGGGGQGTGSQRTYTVTQGGVSLTATFDAGARSVQILTESVSLKDANVVLVDDVDLPSGPRVVKTLSVDPEIGDTQQFQKLLLKSPELLDYLQCHVQIPDPMNRATMPFVCDAAIVTGLVKTPVSVTRVPEGPVQNKAAATFVPMPQRSSSSGGGFGGGPSSPMTEPGRILSSVVVSGFFAHAATPGPMELDLLVLWRGSPGWYLKSVDGSSRGGGGSGGNGTSLTMTVRRGGLELFVRHTPAAREAQIQDKTIQLRDANVVLVDDVDSPGGPKVVRTLRIDPMLEERPMIEFAIRRSPDLVSFMRCDVKLPNPGVQPMIDLICGRMQGK